MIQTLPSLPSSSPLSDERDVSSLVEWTLLLCCSFVVIVITMMMIKRWTTWGWWRLNNILWPSKWQNDDRNDLWPDACSQQWTRRVGASRVHFWIIVFNSCSRFWGFYDTSESQIFLFWDCISESVFSIFARESDVFVSHLSNCSALLFFCFFRCTSE